MNSYYIAANGDKVEYPIICPHCKSKRAIKCGYVVLKKLPKTDNKLPKYLCKECRKTFYDREDYNHRVRRLQFLAQRLIIHLVLSGMSLSRIKSLLEAKNISFVPHAIQKVDSVIQALNTLDIIPEECVVNEIDTPKQFVCREIWDTTLVIEESWGKVQIGLEHGDKNNLEDRLWTKRN